MEYSLCSNFINFYTVFSKIFGFSASAVDHQTHINTQFQNSFLLHHSHINIYENDFTDHSLSEFQTVTKRIEKLCMLDPSSCIHSFFFYGYLQNHKTHFPQFCLSLGERSNVFYGFEP